MVKNPNWQEADSWLFTSSAEELNQGLPRNNSNLVVRVGLEPVTFRDFNKQAKDNTRENVLLTYAAA